MNQKIISIIPAKTQLVIKDVDIVMDAEYLAGLTEKVTGNITVELSAEEKVICCEANGILANVRLTHTGKQRAVAIYACLD